jgi:hypothetical protein
MKRRIARSATANNTNGSRWVGLNRKCTMELPAPGVPCPSCACAKLAKVQNAMDATIARENVIGNP